MYRPTDARDPAPSVDDSLIMRLQRGIGDFVGQSVRDERFVGSAVATTPRDSRALRNALH